MTVAGSRPAPLLNRTTSSNGMVSTWAPIEEKTVAQAAGAARGRFRVAPTTSTDFATGFGLQLTLSEIHNWHHSLAHNARSPDILIGSLAATLKGNAERVELLL